MTKKNNIYSSQNQNVCTAIAGIIKSNLSPKAMAEKLREYHKNDVAMSLCQLKRDECLKLFRILENEEIAEILEYASDNVEYFKLLPKSRRADVIECMSAYTSSDILENLTDEEESNLFKQLDPSTKDEISLVRSFDDDEIGSRMSTDYISIPDGATVKQAMSRLVKQASESCNISTLYTVDSNDTFCGAIDLKDLIIAREYTPLSEITTLSYPYLYARSKISDCITYIADYAEESIPVLDDDNKLIGVVTSNDLLEMIDDEMSDDYAKLGGLTQEEDLSEPMIKSVKKRIPWLMVLLLLGLGVSAAVGAFESIVAQLPIIMCFQSLILDMSGNVGTQSLAVAIRVLSDTDVNKKHKAHLVSKEIRIGIMNGLLIGLVSLVAIGGYLILKGYVASFAFAISGCLCISMILAMTVSSLFGTLIPIFFEHIGVDPAVASGPLITTVNDLVAVVTYYGLSWIILIDLLHLV